MFAWWGRAVVRTRWWVLAAGLALVVAGATWGAGVFGALTGGGYADPGSEAMRAYERIADEVGREDPDLVVLWTGYSGTADDPAFRAAVGEVVTELRARPEVVSVVSYLDPQAPPTLVSDDRYSTYGAITLVDGDEDTKIAALRAVEDDLAPAGVQTHVGGNVAFLDQSNSQTEKDIVRAEIISLPVLLLLLILIFRGLIAALSPLLIGGVAILGAFVAVRALTYVTEISVFAINVITLLGLGMAVDYALFVVSRFREELGNGRDVPDAIRITVATAGRTVMVSGLTIVLALSSLLIFPQPFLGGMAIGGMAAVFIAMLAALTVLPAALVLLGRRIDSLRIPLPRLRRHPGEPGAGWARLARSVMRRPVLYAVGVILVLGLFAVPFTRVQFGGFDEQVLPADTPARIVAERIRGDFPSGPPAPIDVLVSGTSQAGAESFAARVDALDGVTGARVSGSRGDASVVSVGYDGAPTSEGARELVGAIRDLPPPAGAEVLVTGRPAYDLDLLESLAQKLPWMALIMAGATMVLLFLAFGSVLLPIKAVLMNLVSIGASFGVVVWIFQDGHLEGLLRFQSTGFIEPSNMILVLAVLFGLATDYEVFLLSRVREEWDRTGDNTSAVATGLQRTGRIITAAALLLIVVVAGFATGGVTVIKTIGVGMIVAIIVDATLVRALLVPATMRLLGRWNWWAPGPLARVYRRYGISESEPAPRREPAPVG
ncbi:MMPL family transporter [Spirilliplanes yamanashiensis]|uniref:Membrane protein n=1 Tax=Spirilliplanes yamanashiensis TaxID=42233 RepID=A0A8J3Y4C4_9ACTN|nr:MMPL family transporter [Spirilliplanes yamanashiensis]MDP9819674.1 RND superfamily putative drug exporter [Spirilliplanes yamanashiensis]GIJ01506.1 membrane protein [Spirilliplanes yamanashiensis]